MGDNRSGKRPSVSNDEKKPSSEVVRSKKISLMQDARAVYAPRQLAHMHSKETEEQSFGFESMDGFTLPIHPYKVPWQQHIDHLRHMTLRDDDIFLYAYPKAGTHWMWEVCHMLLSGKAEYEARTKEHLMMEFTTIDRLDADSSPRILNTHLPFSMLPVAAMKQKKIKVLHVYRNPKDSVVSMWFHFKQFDFLSKLSLSQFVQLSFAGKMAFGAYPYYLQQMEQFMNDNPDMSFFNISFEETKVNPVKVVKQLAEFLGVEASEQLCQDISDACSFQKMKQADQNKKIPEGMGIPLDQEIYRKGEVGDWKNHMTVADSEAIDQFIADGLKDLTKFTLHYTPIDTN